MTPGLGLIVISMLLQVGEQQLGSVQSFDGLIAVDRVPSERTRAVLQDSDGFVWIGTDDGLLQYDGAEVVIYKNIRADSSSIGSNDVYAIYQGAFDSGTIWIGTDAGLSRLNLATRHFSSVGRTHVEETESKGRTVRAIESDGSDRLLIGMGRRFSPDPASGGLLVLNLESGAITRHVATGAEGSLLNSNIHAIIRGRGGRIWIGSEGGIGSLQLDPLFVHNYKPHSDRPEHWSNSVQVIEEAMDGSLWLGTGEGICQFIPATGNSVCRNPDPEFARGRFSNYVSAISPLGKDALLVGTLFGLYRFDIPSFRFVGPENLTSRAFGVSEAIVSDIFRTEEGERWFATDRGLYRTHEGNYVDAVVLPSPSNGDRFANLISSIAENEYGLWFGSGAGLHNLSAGKMLSTFLPVASRVRGTENSVLSLAADSGANLWVGTSAGLLAFSAEQQEFKRVATHGEPPAGRTISSGDIFDIVVAKDTALWLATSSGLCRMRVDRSQTACYSAHMGTADESILGVHSIWEAPENTFFVGAEDDNLYRFDRAQRAFRREAPWEDTGFEAISMLQISSAEFWVGTQNSGLVKYSVSGGEIERVDIRNSSLSSNTINCLIETDGRLWMSTGSGVSTYTTRTGDVWNYDNNSLLAGFDFVPGSCFQTAAGQVIFGGVNGAIIFDPKLFRNSLPPRIAVLGINLGEKQIRLARTRGHSGLQSSSELLSIPHGENARLSFDYVALHFQNPTANRYHHRIVEIDEEWFDAGADRQARFPRLPSGHYEFQVKASNNHGVWSEPASVYFEILPPWWRTWPAYLLYGLMALGLVFSADRYRHRHLLKKERERAAIEEARLRVEAAELQAKVLKSENERKELELQKARELEAAYDELEATLQDLRRTQTQLVHAEKMASLGQLAAGIAHEIKNPLNFINNFAELNTELADKLKSLWQSERVDDTRLTEVQNLLGYLRLNASKIAEQGKQADRIVKSMLLHARGATGNKEGVDLNALVDTSIDLAYHGLRAHAIDFDPSIERSYDESLGKVEVVAQELSRVLVNLLNNAFEALQDQKTRESGVIPTVWIKTRRLQNSAEITIRDNGPGIPADIRSKVFEPFFTTKPAGSGTGLGLSLSYEIIVEGHGGKLIMDTGGESGVAFVVTLPMT